MKVVNGIAAVDPPLEHSVLTIGNFDGVHRAHQQLLAQAGLFAANTGGPVVVLTFEPHPLTVVAPDKAPPRLSLPEEKLRCLARAGADVTVVAHSEPALLSLEADRFVDEIIRRRFHPTHVVEGPSFGFGKGRQGTCKLLRKLAAGFGAELHVVEPVTLQIDEGETLMVSSSLIRRLIADGKLHRAALCLGRRYAVIGPVVSGDRRGVTLGFPTANLAIHDQLIPGDGVYAGLGVAGGETHLCAISVGRTPTFGRRTRLVEAHLLDFDGDLYGQSMRLEFDRPIRLQETFRSADALVAQIERDLKAVREVFRDNRPGFLSERIPTS